MLLPAFSAAQQPGFKRPQAKHRTSKPVPKPWLGHGHDDHPEIRNATYLKTPAQIQAMPIKGGGDTDKLSYPESSGLRIVATGHSWMRPGFGTLPEIAKAAGLEQRLRVNYRGGELGAARMMWELENGILSSRGKSNPVCLSAITTGKWDAMLWGSYTNDYWAWMAEQDEPLEPAGTCVGTISMFNAATAHSRIPWDERDTWQPHQWADCTLNDGVTMEQVMETQARHGELMKAAGYEGWGTHVFTP